MLKTTCALLVLTLSLEGPATAGSCARPAEATALEAAVIQQKLMVAAFQCRETSAYNRFVIHYRGELQASDAVLKTYFVRRGGEAGYDSFKTKAANIFGLEQARHSDAFCASAHALFAAAFSNRSGLASFVESRFAGRTCVEPRTVLSTASQPVANPGRVRMAQARPADDDDGGYNTAPSPDEAPPRRDGRDYYRYAPPPPPPSSPPFRFGWGHW
ncbi:MAG TPA: hypothetical protein VN175_06340 [Rhizomicrobium sp.]|nr:hypothetical protein [Rhizomicrobium sp.]